jgi:hypothetical protein
LSTPGAITPSFNVYESKAAGGNSGSDIGSPGPGFVLTISQVMYHPASPEEGLEWVEIYNSGDSIVNLSGYVFDDNNGLAHDGANIISGMIGPGGTAILYNIDEVMATKFTAAWGPNINLIPTTNWASGALNNGGDQIGLWSNFANYKGDHTTHSNAIYSINFRDSIPWPDDDGLATIYLKDLSACPEGYAPYRKL